MRTPKKWFTRKRLATHGLLLGLALWSIYMWTLATPGLRDRNGNLKGTDFLHFYTLGSLAVEHDGAHLYDIAAQSALASQRVPAAAGIQYLPLYPPQVSILFAPMARFSYTWALVLWWVTTAITYGVCCYLVWRVCPNLREHGVPVTILAIAFPPFFNLIAWGQTSALALACFTVAFLLLRQQRHFATGLALGLLAFKPQLGLAAAILFVAVADWRLVFGAAISGVTELGVGILYYGTRPFAQWINTVAHSSTVLSWFEPRPYQTHCLRTFWSMLVPWNGVAAGLYLISTMVVMLTVHGVWRRGGRIPLSVRYSSLLLASVLVSPHLTVYDLVILAPGIMILSDWLVVNPELANRSWIATFLYFVYALPLLGPLTRWTHLQLSVIAMVGLLYLIWKIGFEGRKVQAAEAATTQTAVRLSSR